jgi:protein-L-isoaspartate(D-aspartate) O-methyltransferase
MDIGVVRDDMVDGLAHEAKGVLETGRVAEALGSVPRHEFVDTDTPEAAYEDRAFERRGTTVLAPSLVARLLEALDPAPDDDVLVVGSGVGYTAAAIAEIVGHRSVSAIDLSRPLVMDARRNLAAAGYDAVLVDRRDGAEGFPEYAPYDGVLIEAAATEPPDALLRQLAPGGRLVMPKGTPEQELVAIEDGEVTGRHGAVRFKPLLVEGEQTGGIERNRTTRESRERAAERSASQSGWERDWIDWKRAER